MQGCFRKVLPQFPLLNHWIISLWWSSSPDTNWRFLMFLLKLFLWLCILRSGIALLKSFKVESKELWFCSDSLISFKRDGNLFNFEATYKYAKLLVWRYFENMFIGARTANRRRNNVIEGSKSWSLTPSASASPF